MGTRVNPRWILSVILVACPAAGIDDGLPDLEMLEYLSNWHDGDGQLLEPAMFDDEPLPDSTPTSGESDARD